MDSSSTNRIEKSVELAAPADRVWRALTDYHEFGEWFGVRLEGPFVAGQMARGAITYPGYEHVVMEVLALRMEPPRLFGFAWHPYAIGSAVDYSREEPTLVEFRLDPTASGTRLTVTESGFDKLPLQRRDEAYQMNDGGWTEQMKNIAAHLQKHP
jgi:uncharacterized protein YndB with AHSA1/START domain